MFQLQSVRSKCSRLRQTYRVWMCLAGSKVYSRNPRCSFTKEETSNECKNYSLYKKCYFVISWYYVMWHVTKNLIHPCTLIDHKFTQQVTVCSPSTHPYIRLMIALPTHPYTLLSLVRPYTHPYTCLLVAHWFTLTYNSW